MTVNQEAAEALAARLRGAIDAIHTFQEAIRLASQPDMATDVTPGMTGTATVRGVEGVRVMRVEVGQPYQDPGIQTCWRSARGVPSGDSVFYNHDDSGVTDFIPDDASLWRQKCEELESSVREMKAAPDDASACEICGRTGRDVIYRERSGVSCQDHTEPDDDEMMRATETQCGCA